MSIESSIGVSFGPATAASLARRRRVNTNSRKRKVDALLDARAEDSTVKKVDETVREILSSGPNTSSIIDSSVIRFKAEEPKGSLQPEEEALQVPPNQEERIEEDSSKDVKVTFSTLFIESAGVIHVTNHKDVEKKEEFDKLFSSFLTKIRSQKFEEGSLLGLYQQGDIRSIVIDFIVNTLTVTYSDEAAVFHINLSDNEKDWENGTIDGVTCDDWQELKKAYFQLQGKENRPIKYVYEKRQIGPANGKNPSTILPPLKKENFQRKIREVSSQIFDKDTIDERKQLAEKRKEKAEELKNSVVVFLNEKIEELSQSFEDDPENKMIQNHLFILRKIKEDIEKTREFELEIALLFREEKKSEELQLKYFRNLFNHIEKIFLNERKTIFSRNPTLSREEKEYILLYLIGLSSSSSYRSCFYDLFLEKVEEGNSFHDPLWERALSQTVVKGINLDAAKEIQEDQEKIKEVFSSWLFLLFSKYGLSENLINDLLKEGLFIKSEEENPLDNDDQEEIPLEVRRRRGGDQPLK